MKYTLYKKLFCQFTLIIALVAAALHNAVAQNCTIPVLNQRLIEMKATEQKLRRELMPVLADFQKDGSRQMEMLQLAMKMKEVDQKNLEAIKVILNDCGWLEALDEEAHNALFIILQHGDYETMKQYYPTVAQMMEKGKLAKDDWAAMTDRLLMNEGKLQIYGTQTFADGQNGNWVWPVEKPEELPSRRTAVGLPDMETYFKIAMDSMGVKMQWDKTMTLEEAESRRRN